MALKIDCETNCAVISSSCTTRLYKNKFTNILKWKIDGEAFSEERAVIVQCVCGGGGGRKRVAAQGLETANGRMCKLLCGRTKRKD